MLWKEPYQVHESKALQFELGYEQQIAEALENPCLWRKNQHPVFHQIKPCQGTHHGNELDISKIMPKIKTDVKYDNKTSKFIISNF